MGESKRRREYIERSLRERGIEPLTTEQLQAKPGTPTMAMAWDNYKRMIVPPDTTNAAVAELQTAFMAGAAILWTIIIHTMDPGPDETDRDMSKMDSLDQEFQKFGEQFDIRYILNTAVPKGTA